MATSKSIAPRFCGALGALALLMGGHAVAQPVSITAGVSVRGISGTFGSSNTTTVVYVQANLRIDVGRFETSFSLPYLGIMDGTVALSQGGFVPMQGSLTSAPAVGMSMSPSGSSGGSMSGGMMSGSNGSAATTTDGLSSSWLTNQNGVGDIVGAVGYRIVDNALSGVQVVASGRFKLPTASATRGLGTGRTDVGASTTIRKQFDGGWLSAEGGYLRVGDPVGVDLQNAAFWSVGGGRRISRQASLLALAAGSTAILREFGAPIEVGVGLGVRATDHLTFTVLPTVGLSDASPRFALTVGLSQRVFER